MKERKTVIKGKSFKKRKKKKEEGADFVRAERNFVFVNLEPTNMLGLSLLRTQIN